MTKKKCFTDFPLELNTAVAHLPKIPLSDYLKGGRFWVREILLDGRPVGIGQADISLENDHLGIKISNGGQSVEFLLDDMEIIDPDAEK